MTNTFCTFAYADDEPLVRLCTEQLLTVCPGARIFVASDRAAPIKTAPPGTTLIQTTFPRGGNLNGLPAVLGVLDTLRWCIQQTRSDYIIKLDADTWVQSLAPLTDGKEDYLACEAYEPFCPGGNAVRISRWAVSRVLSYYRTALAEGTTSPTWHYPEDRSIFNAVRACRLPHRLVPYNSGATIGMTDQLPLPPRITKAAFVHAGEPLPGGIRAHRAHVLLRMQLLKHFTHPQA